MNGVINREIGTVEFPLSLSLSLSLKLISYQHWAKLLRKGIKVHLRA